MFGWGKGQRDEPEFALAAEDADQLSERAVRLVESATGGSWYTDPGNEVDAAVVALCRLRRAQAGRRKTSEGGDEAVRTALELANAEAVLWLASRVISYMDEHGFPEDVEPWLERG